MTLSPSHMADPQIDSRRCRIPASSCSSRWRIASSAVFFAASELDVFTRIGRWRSTTADELADALRRRAPSRCACCSRPASPTGCSTRDGDASRNTPATDAFLVARPPGLQRRHGLKYAEDLYPAWGALADLVRTGRPTDAARDDSRRRQGEDPRVRVGDARARAGHRLGAAARVDLTRPQAPARRRRRSRHLLGRARAAHARTDVDGARSARACSK